MRRCSRQRGIVLLVVLLLLIAGSAAWVAVRDPAGSAAAQAGDQTARALAKARTALKAYALAGGSHLGSPPRPGTLPCPDRRGNGRIDSFPCLNAVHPGLSQMGLFPWASLQLPELRDAAGEALWYVLDPALRNSPAAEPVHPDAAGGLVVDGEPGYAAVVIAPGEARAGQSRPAVFALEPSAWLDGRNAEPGDSTYADCQAAPGCNDRLIAIHRDELFDGVQQRVLAEIEAVLRAHFHAKAATSDGRHLPWAAPLGGTECERGRLVGSLPLEPGNCGAGGAIDASALPHWVLANDWLSTIVYRVAQRCTRTSADCANADLRVDDQGGHAAVIAAAGARLPGQDRTGSPPHAIGAYLDDPAHADAGGHYRNQRPVRPGVDNDVFRGIRLP